MSYQFAFSSLANGLRNFLKKIIAEELMHEQNNYLTNIKKEQLRKVA